MPKKAQATINQAKFLAETLLLEHFLAAQANKELGPAHDAKQLAQYFVTLLHGTAAMARAGKSLAEMELTIDMALKIIE